MLSTARAARAASPSVFSVGVGWANGFAGTLVGFAAETENLEANAREKLAKKGCDLVIANDVSQPGIGFDSDRNEVLLVYPERSVALPADEKEHLAIHLVEAILALAADRTHP